MAPVVTQYKKSNEAPVELEKVNTPDARTIEEVASFLNVEASSCIKSLLFKVDDRFVLVLARGDHEINDIKVKNYFEATVVELATPEEAKEVMAAQIGSLGPIQVSEKIEVVADHAVKAVVNGVCGANEDGVHYQGVNPERDFTATYEDFRFIQEGDASPDGQGIIKFAKGIEVGHVFKLGTRYSEAWAQHT